MTAKQHGQRLAHVLLIFGDKDCGILDWVRHHSSTCGECRWHATAAGRGCGGGTMG